MRWLVVGLVLLVPGTAAAQGASRECTGSPPDSAWLAAGPVYRNCEVDTPAKRKGTEPEFSSKHFVAHGNRFECRAATVEFVVDLRGRADTTTFRIAQSDDPALTTAIFEILPALRFDPARLGPQPVRQLVTYTRAVSRGTEPFQVPRLAPGRSLPSATVGSGARLPLEACEKK